eukprot:15455223-Alexandrium_andersonii.AAC.1
MSSSTARPTAAGSACGASMQFSTRRLAVPTLRQFPRSIDHTTAPAPPTPSSCGRHHHRQSECTCRTPA